MTAGLCPASTRGWGMIRVPPTGRAPHGRAAAGLALRAELNDGAGDRPPQGVPAPMRAWHGGRRAAGTSHGRLVAPHRRRCLARREKPDRVTRRTGGWMGSRQSLIRSFVSLTERRRLIRRRRSATASRSASCAKATARGGRPGCGRSASGMCRASHGCLVSRTARLMPAAWDATGAEPVSCMHPAADWAWAWAWVWAWVWAWAWAWAWTWQRKASHHGVPRWPGVVLAPLAWDTACRATSYACATPPA